jgi:RNA polymerase sigma factor (sigma-70 family)
MEDHVEANPVTMRDLLDKAKQGDNAARSEMVERSMPIVRRMASHYCAVPPPDREELVQIGALALQCCADRWDADRVAWSTFAVNRVRGAMSRHYVRCKVSVAPPMVSVKSLQAEAGADATTDDEHRRRDAARGAAGLRGCDCFDRRAVVVFPGPDAEEQFAAAEAVHALRRAIAENLDGSERDVMERRRNGMTQRSIAAELGFTQQGINQIEIRALERLRAVMTDSL